MVTDLRDGLAHGLPVVQPFERSRLAEGGALLARAFTDDPLWRWVLQGRREPEPALRWLFERALVDQRTARLETVAGPLVGLATWIGPETEPPPPPLRTLVGAIVRLRAGFPRLLRYAREAAILERELSASRGWRLGGIAVEPAEQGRGHGSALVRHGLDRADAAGLPVLLLTSNPANVAFYERHGFAVAAERRLPEAGPPGWAMVRPARPIA